MTLIGGIVLNRFLLNLLIRSMEQFGRGGPNEKSISRKALLSGMGVALFLACYQPIIRYFQIDILSYNQTQGASYFGVLVLMIIISILLLISNKKPITQWMGMLIVILTLFYLGAIARGISALVIYVLLTATSEELLKSMSLRPLYQNLLSDLILFGICAGLGFAWIENIIYLISLIPNNTITDGFIAARYFSAVPLHAVWTGMIGALYMWGWNKNLAFVVICGIIGVIIIHAGYNYLLHSNTPLFSIPLIIVSYVGLAGLLLKVERLYIKDAIGIKE